MSDVFTLFISCAEIRWDIFFPGFPGCSSSCSYKLYLNVKLKSDDFKKQAISLESKLLVAVKKSFSKETFLLKYLHPSYKISHYPPPPLPVFLFLKISCQVSILIKKVKVIKEVQGKRIKWSKVILNFPGVESISPLWRHAK